MSVTGINLTPVVAQRAETTLARERGVSLHEKIKNIKNIEQNNYAKVDALIKKIIRLNQSIRYTPLSTTGQTAKNLQVKEEAEEVKAAMRELDDTLNRQEKIVQMKGDLHRQLLHRNERTPQPREFNQRGDELMSTHL